MRQKHQKRVLLNLLLTAVLALFLWAHDGYPLPTLEMELHRAERQTLAEESRVVWSREKLAYYEPPSMAVSVSPHFVHTYAESEPMEMETVFYGVDPVTGPSHPRAYGEDEPLPARWPRAVTEPTLVILPEDMPYPSTELLFAREETPALLAVDPPLEAETARLTIDFFRHIGDTKSFFAEYGDTRYLYDKYRQEFAETDGLVPYVIQGQKQGEVFFFQVDARRGDALPEDAGRDLHDSRDLADMALWFVTHTAIPEDMACYPYTLEFFDAGGTLIASYDNPAAGGAAAPER